MLTLDQIRSLARFEIFGKQMPAGQQSGNYKSKQHGSGLEFDELREYQMGDDVRAIDWNSSVRTDKLLVKKYKEEVNRSIMILLDGSSSMFYGSSDQLKYNFASQIIGIIAASALYSDDSVGLMIYQDAQTLLVKPKNSVTQLQTIFNAVIDYKPTAKVSASLNKVAAQYISLQKSGTLVMVISDFVDETYQNGLNQLSRLHDVVAIRILDRKEKNFALGALINLDDSESDIFVPSIIYQEEKMVAAAIGHYYQAQELFFKRYGIACYTIVSPIYSLEKFIYFLQYRLMR